MPSSPYRSPRAPRRKLVEVPPELHEDLALLAIGRRSKLKFIVMEAVAAYVRVHESEARRYRHHPALSLDAPPPRGPGGRYIR